MLDRLEVLVVEDDLSDRNAIIKEIEANAEYFHLAYSTASANDAFEFTKAHRPKIIILDLELHRGYGDGIEFLKALAESAVRPKPYIVITTNNLSGTIWSTARQLGADYVFSKAKRDYSPKLVISHLITVMPQISENYERFESEPTEQLEKRIRNRVFDEFVKLGMKTSHNGCKFLIDAVLLVVNGQTELLSNKIAEKTGEKKSTVERDMQYAIDYTWEHGNTNDLENNYTAKFSLKRGSPTTTEFVFYYAQKIKNEL